MNLDRMGTSDEMSPERIAEIRSKLSSLHLQFKTGRGDTPVSELEGIQQEASDLFNQLPEDKKEAIQKEIEDEGLKIAHMTI